METEKIRLQLGRILSNGLFKGGGRSTVTGRRLRAARQSAKFLRYLIEQALSGSEISEMSVLIEVFGRKSEDLYRDDAIARAHLQIVRKKLAEYYLSDGIRDPVIIDIPRGSFDPVFTERELPDTPDKEIERGLFHINQEAPSNIARALAHFEEALRQNPKNADAHACKAMALSTLTLHGLSVSAATFLARAETEAEDALDLDVNCWRAHAALGGIHAFRRNWQGADREFLESLRINRDGTFGHGAYGLYLLGRGNYEAALALAKRYEDQNPTDVTLLKRAALYRYAMRDFAGAERLLAEIFGMAEGLWHAHMLSALLSLRNDQPSEALRHMRKFAGAGDDPEIWCGLYVLCLERSGHREEARLRFDVLIDASECGYIEPLQLALGYIAFNEPLSAIEWLEKGVVAGNAHMLWLHLWPFLDPLRAHPNFKALLSTLGLPSAPK
ncbi:MAG TPA: hypothetical protein VHW09_27355 [Bryobacteraceae bacterium]|nr:hypothetical protein [Bryobacteraceae bacterium]